MHGYGGFLGREGCGDAPIPYLPAPIHYTHFIEILYFGYMYQTRDRQEGCFWFKCLFF